MAELTRKYAVMAMAPGGHSLGALIAYRDSYPGPVVRGDVGLRNEPHRKKRK